MSSVFLSCPTPTLTCAKPLSLSLTLTLTLRIAKAPDQLPDLVVLCGMSVELLGVLGMEVSEQCESEGGCSCVRGRPAAARALSSKLVFIIGVGLVCVHCYHARSLATLIRDRRRQATALCAFCTLTHMIGVD